MEASAGGHLNGFTTAGPLDVSGITGEGAGDCQDFARFDADVLGESFNPWSRTWNPKSMPQCTEETFCKSHFMDNLLHGRGDAEDSSLFSQK